MKLTHLTALTAISFAALVGCQDKNQNGFFKGDQAGESVKKFSSVQAANGARNDAMLYPHHFSGGHLNSLGRQKVLMMLEDCDNCEPTTVHLVNCGTDDLLSQRKAAVELYMKSAEGPNTLTFHPAQTDVVRFNKTESGKAEDASGDAAASDAAAPAAGAAAAAPAN